MDERRSGMDELITNVALLHQKVESDVELTQKVHDILLGNGGEGLVTKVAVGAKQTQNNTKAISWLWKTVVGLTVLSGVAAGVVKALP